MAITASAVKELREQTGAGMMACKDALKETDGKIDAAVDYLRKKGLAAAQKKQSRIAAEGAVVSVSNGKEGIILEVNCETDFVSKGDEFQNFAKKMAEWTLENKPNDINELKDAMSTEVNELTLKCGEKIDLRRFTATTSDGALGQYNHGGKIGVLVSLKTSESGEKITTLARDLAMHVAASSPAFLKADDIDEDFKKRESAIYRAQLLEEGKPENMIDKIIMGKLAKLAKQVCLLEQSFVKDPDMTIKKLIASVGSDIEVVSFHKLNLGEGIEKKEDNLADEVAKMTGKK